MLEDDRAAKAARAKVLVIIHTTFMAFREFITVLS
jgi:hypothetical protein